MIVEKGKQPQQQQVRQRNLIARNCQALSSVSGGGVGEDSGGDNDEENIVIDMAEEEDDDDGEEYDDDDRLESNNAPHNYRLDNHEEMQNYGSISVCSSKSNNNNSHSTINNNGGNEFHRFRHKRQDGFSNNNNNNSGKVQDDESMADDDNLHEQDTGHEIGEDGEIEEFHFNTGDLVWFDPNQFGYSIPGKVLDYYPGLNMLTVEGYAQPAPVTSDLAQVYANPHAYDKLLLDADHEMQTYDLSDLQQIRSVKFRVPLSNEFGMNDLVDLDEMSLESVAWNLKLRYKQELVYTRCGLKILLSVNPYKQLSSLYNLDQANKYDTLNTSNLSAATKCCQTTLNETSHDTNHQLHRWLLIEEQQASALSKNRECNNKGQEDSPHIFQMANEALKSLLVTGQDQCFVLLGDSGAGKTEACKLLIQYLATVNKSPSNLMTEQILESIQVLESFGNAKTILNDNSSRFGKLLEIRFNLADGFIINAKTSDLNLLDRSRIVGQAENERNYHVFYEMLAGLSKAEREKYGLQTTEKYFYLNQGHCIDLPAKEDGDDFRSLLASTQVLGFSGEEQDAILRILSSVLHLGNVYFHRKVLALRSGKLAQQNQRVPLQKTPATSGVEGVEVGSDTEIRWVSHLLQIQFDSVMRCLTVRTTESQVAGGGAQDRIITPLNIDQALDTRDAIARALYTCLFKWLIERINATINAGDSDKLAQSCLNDATHHDSQLTPGGGGPVYLCRTSESLCEFQPDKLADSRQSSMSKRSSRYIVGHARGRSQLQAATISILDTFGFEDLIQNNFEQLCINYTAELMQYHANRYLLRLEQAEYARERLRWQPFVFPAQVRTGLQGSCGGGGSMSSNYSASAVANNSQQGAGNSIVSLISKKPLGILALLDDECNFPKATDQSFAEKCHHNHALNENYQRARLEASWQEFGVRHFRHPNRLVWYQVEGFIEKNRDALRPDIVELLVGSRMGILADILRKLAVQRGQDGSLARQSGQRTLSRTYDGRYVSMKPRAGTVSARFQDALLNNCVIESLNGQVSATAAATAGGKLPSAAQPWFVLCLKPNRSKSARVFDVAFVEEQARCMGLLELVHARKFGYPVRMRYNQFVRRYKCLVPQKHLSGLLAGGQRDLYSMSSEFGEAGEHSKAKQQQMSQKRAIREVCAAIVCYRKSHSEDTDRRPQYQCGLTKMFLNERLHKRLESMRLQAHQSAIALLQRTIRMWLVRREFIEKRQAAILLQAQWRGYLARRTYWYQYAMLLNLQRRWREWLLAKRRATLEAKRRIQRQQQQRQLLELQSQQRLQADQFRHRLAPQPVVVPVSGGGSTSGYGYGYASRPLGLDIPEDLAQLYRHLRNWTPVHGLANLSSVNLAELMEREVRRREKHKNKSTSVPFVATLDHGGDDDELEFLDDDVAISDTQLADGTASALGLLLYELEMDEKYSLQSLLLTHYSVEAPQFGYSRLPITRPFSWPRLVRQRRRKLRRASPDKESAIYQNYTVTEQKAIAIYKLILRYIDSDLHEEPASAAARNQLESIGQESSSNDDGGRALQKVIKFKLIADYVIYLCIQEPLLRDEVYLQLVSQSWQNPKAKSSENVWKLMANCLSCFSPRSHELSKFLLRHASDHCCDKYRRLVIKLLAHSLHQPELSRQHRAARKYPTTMLEYWANQQATGRLALAASCYMDDHALNGPPVPQLEEQQQVSLEDLTTTNHSNRTLVQVNPRTSAEELARAALRARQVPAANLAGWSVEIQHEGALSEFSCRLRGDERVFDHFAHLELLPEFAHLIENQQSIYLDNDENQQTSPIIAASQHHAPMENNHQRRSSSGGARRRRKQVSASEFSAHDAALRRHSLMSQRSNDLPVSGGYAGATHYHQPPTRRHNKRVSSELDLTTAARMSQASRSSRVMYTNDEIASNYSNPIQSYHTSPYGQPMEQMQILNGYGRQHVGGGRAARRVISPTGAPALHSFSHNRRSLSMQELQLASSALNERYFGGGAPNGHYHMPPPPPDMVPHAAYSGHYASSFITPAMSHHMAPGVAAPYPQQPMQTGHKRRSRTPNRHSSSAYGSESRHSNLSSSMMDHPQHPYHPSQLPASSTGSLSRPTNGRDSQSRPRRSASSSSRQLPLAAHSDYASAQSDYERVGAAGGHYAAPNLASQMPPMEAANRWPQQRPNNPLVERHKAPKQHVLREQRRAMAAQAQVEGKLSLDRAHDGRLGGKNKLPAAGCAAGPAYGYLGSSAVSDTSEAPSLASHVRGIKVPQHNADLDQYLDDLFNPMLDDAELDELSDARSLAASIRGCNQLPLDDDLSCLQDACALSKLIRGTTSDNNEPATGAGPLSPTFESLLRSLRANEPDSSQQQHQQLAADGTVPGEEARAEDSGNQVASQSNFESPTLDDMYSRAKTVRIGKWRWPPAADESAANVKPADHEDNEPDSQATGDEQLRLQPDRGSEGATEVDSSHGKSVDDEAALMPPPPPPPLDALFQQGLLGSNAMGSVGKLKISSEMKAKLEQLTNSTGAGRDSATPSGAAKPSEPLAESADKTQSVKRLADQRRALLESQLASGSANKDTSHTDTAAASAEVEVEPSGSKILAAKQQLAAAAGLALAVLDGGLSEAGSQASSRRQSTVAGAQAGQQVDSAEDAARRSRVMHDDELGPQSRAAISQRQAFYQTMSASSDQLAAETDTSRLLHQPGSSAEAQLGGSELQLPRTTSPSQRQLVVQATVSSDNLSPQQVSAMAKQPAKQTLTRTVPMASNLNKIGRHEDDNERPYGQSVAKSVLQRQHESLVGASRSRAGNHRLSSGTGASSNIDHQWVASSPDPTLEHAARRRAKHSAPRVGYPQAGANQHQRISSSGGRPSAGGVGGNQSRARATMATDVHKLPQRQQVEQAAERQCFVYGNVDWQVRIRKEFFLPSETYEDPLVVQLIFAQLVADVFNPRQWTRLNNKERAAIKSLMKDNSIGYAPSLPQIGQLQPVKQELVRMARSFGLYFTRSYPALNFALSAPDSDRAHRIFGGSSAGSSCDYSSSSSDSGELDATGERAPGACSQAAKLAQRLRNANNLGAEWIDMVAVHHSGLRLVALEQQQQQPMGASSVAPNSPGSSGYRVLETLKYRDMTDVSQVGKRELLVSMRNGKKCWLLSSEQASQLGSLLKCFHADYNDHFNHNNNSKNIDNSCKSSATTRAIPGLGGQSALQRKHNKLSGPHNKDALLAADDDHHDDRIEQRQASNRIGKLHPAPRPNYDLADGERVLPSHLASTNQASEQRQQSATISSAPDGAGPPNGRDETSGLLEEGGSSSKQQQVAGGKSGAKRNLWQNSLSRMSNKFSIFGGSQSRATTNYNNNNSSSAKQVSVAKQANGSQQEQHQQQQQVVLDAWIETKVDFDEDDDDTDDDGNDIADSVQQQTSCAEPEVSLSRESGGEESASLRGAREPGDGSVRSKQSRRTSGAPDEASKQQQQAGTSSGDKAEDGKYSLLQFALYNFREAIDKYSLESRASKVPAAGDTSTLRGSLKLIETLRNSREPNNNNNGHGSSSSSNKHHGGTKERAKSSKSLLLPGGASDQTGEWTWRELAEMVKFTPSPLRHSLLKLPSDELSKRAVDCFAAIMQYMGDAPSSATKHQQQQLVPGGEVECVYLILINCHNYPQLRDEIYCQLMKQTTNNRSAQPDSCLRGWRLFSIVAAYFDCSPAFKPYLLKYLETAAYDKRRTYCSVAALCLQNLRKTFKYGGRKNVPSIEEIAATSAGRNSKRQIYRLPGGTERVINTKSTTVVDDIIHEICTNMLNVTDSIEMLEFSLYCIADGDLYTMPLSRDEYILDITTELIKNHQQYFLIFCRSSWLYPLRLDSKLYIEVIFNQIAPDYLEGLLLVLPAQLARRQHNNSGGKRLAATEMVEVTPGGKCQPALRLKTKLVRDIARIAALLHRASGTDYMPHKDEIKYLLPKPIIAAMKQQQRSISSATSDHQHHQHSAGSSAASASGSSSASSSASARQPHARADSCERGAGSGADTLSNSAATTNTNTSNTILATPHKWIELVQSNWREMSAFDTLDAKAQFLDIIRHWPLFGSSFFAIKFIQRDLIQPMDFILALNKLGIQMLDMSTHETVHKYTFNEVISTRKVRSEDGALYLDLKCGNLMKRTIIRIQTDQAHEISRLIRLYIDIDLLQQKQHQQQPPPPPPTTTTAQSSQQQETASAAPETM